MTYNTPLNQYQDVVVLTKYQVFHVSPNSVVYSKEEENFLEFPTKASNVFLHYKMRYRTYGHPKANNIKSKANKRNLTISSYKIGMFIYRTLERFNQNRPR